MGALGRLLRVKFTRGGHSGVCDCSRNISSIIYPRCLSSDSLVLLENHSIESCSEDGVKELITVRSGIGRGISSSLPPHPHPGCPICLDVLAHGYHLHVGTIWSKTVGFCYDQCCIADRM